MLSSLSVMIVAISMMRSVCSGIEYASITVAALTVSNQIAAAVVYAPAPADLAADYERRRRQSSGGSEGRGIMGGTAAHEALEARAPWGRGKLSAEEQAKQVRAVMATVFPEAVTLVREARQGLS